jgi:phage terminase large subunit
MTEIAGRQMLNGDVDQASVTLKKVEHYATLIHLNLANDTKRLKNAELLMHHTTYRLGEYLHKASGEDRATLQSTLKRLDQVHDELLAQVFSH